MSKSSQGGYSGGQSENMGQNLQNSSQINSAQYGNSNSGIAMNGQEIRARY